MQTVTAPTSHEEHDPVPTTTPGRGRRLATIVTVGLVAAAAGVGIGVVVDDGSGGGSPAAAPAAAEPGDLYVVEGDTGWMTATGDNSWRLHLSGVSTVLWFKDRPARMSGHQQIEDFVDDWSVSFAGSAPNGAVVAPGGAEGTRPVPVVITDPSFDAATGITTMTVTGDDLQLGDTESWLAGLTADRADANGRIALFIDDGTPSCTPGAGAQCQGANLSGSVLLYDHDLSDINVTGATLEKVVWDYITIDRAKMNGVHGLGADFAYSSMVEAQLTGARFPAARFDSADLTGSSLNGASLVKATFRDANLSGVDFAASDLTYADLSGANVDGADFSDVTFCYTIMPDGSSKTSLLDGAKCVFATPDLSD